MAQAKTTFSAKEFAPFMADLKLPHVDMDSMVASQRKNVEALIEANRCALEGARAVAQRQAEIVREGLERATEAATEVMSPSAPEKKMARQAELAKSAFDASLASYRELYEMATKASEEVFDLVAKRISASFDEFKSASNGVSEAYEAAKKPAKAA